MNTGEVITINKPIGETPLEAIEQARKQHGISQSTKMAYAGRLDPMASGLLLVLVGDECKARKAYEALDKEYEFEILLGIETDTYDVLGVIEDRGHKDADLVKNTSLELVSSQLKKFIGAFEQEYPPYSSVRVSGHPLYWWARKGRLEEVAIPAKKVSAYETELMSSTKISAPDIVSTALERIERVSGDFRQDEIIRGWKTFGERQARQEFPLHKARIVCSSGTYVRSICHHIGGQLGCGGLAYSIKRTRVGKYTL